MTTITTGIPGNAVHLFWHMHLKPCTVLVFTGLLDGDIGYGEDFLDQEKAKAGIFPEPFGKNPFFVGNGDANPVILKGEDRARAGDSWADILTMDTRLPCRIAFSTRL